jgi:hypothetical protein
MNEIRRRDRDADEIARIREIVARHELPDFVTGYEVRLGEVEGDPALWIIFRVAGGPPADRLGRERRVTELRSLEKGLRSELLGALQERFPYVRFEPELEGAGLP